MKILYINSKKADYLQDIAYNGLCKVLGIEQVIDSPWNKKFHFSVKEYPKNFGYVKNSILPSAFGQLNKAKIDAVIVATCNPKAFNHYLKLLPKIADNVPVGFIDGGDRPEIGGDLDRLGSPELYQKVTSKRPFDFIFKREKLLDEKYPENVFPMPFGYNFDHLEYFNNRIFGKKYDVTFWATESHPIRTEVLKIIQDKFDCRKNGSTLGIDFKTFPHKGNLYLKALAQSKIALNFRGGGWDCVRYWEIPAVKTLMLSQKMQIDIPNDFVHKESALFCKDDLSDLEDLCQYHLDHPKETQEIALNGFEHLKKYHSEVKRGKTILQKIEEHL